jgi:cell division protein FtsW
MHKQSAYILVLAVAVLVSIGIVMLFSTGAFALDSHGDQFRLLKKQSFWLGVGFIAAIACALIDYHWWQKSWMVWLVASVILLILCFVHPIGLRYNGSSRWIQAGPATFQASELAKFGSIVLAVVGVLLALIAAETDLGSTTLIGLTILLMMFVAGANYRYLGFMVAVGIGGILTLAWRISERQGRLLAFIHPDQYEKKEGHQQFMSLIALGSGGIDGLGLGNSRQKMYYLPYAETDFIFPVIGEELGLRVTLVIVFCYLLILTAGTLIALNAKDRFGMLLGFGCTFLVGLQALVNIGVTTSLLPNKGLPLPFISYGGSNLFFCLICIGILINIYRQGKEERGIGQTAMMVRVRHLSEF